MKYYCFLKELSWAVYMLIIFAQDRVFSNCFSFKATLRSWKQGFVSLIGLFHSFCCLLIRMNCFIFRCSNRITGCLFERYRFRSGKWTKQIFSYRTFTTRKFRKYFPIIQTFILGERKTNPWRILCANTHSIGYDARTSEISLSYE
jgi:hypothetical protein